MFMHLYMSKMSMFELCNYLSYSVYVYIIYVYRDHPSVVCSFVICTTHSYLRACLGTDSGAIMRAILE